VVKQGKCPVTASPGVCITAFRANGRTFAVVQNMWPVDRDVTVTLPLAPGIKSSSLAAFDLDAVAADSVTADGGGMNVKAHIGPWDSHLVVLSN